MTFSTVGANPTPVVAYEGNYGTAHELTDRGFTLRVGISTVYLTNEQAAALGRYLLFENNEPQPLVLEENAP